MFEKLPIGTQVNREIIFNGKNYKYSVRNLWPDEDSDGEDMYRVVCRAIRLNQDFLREDVNGAIESIADILTFEEKNHIRQIREKPLQIRLNTAERNLLDANAEKYGFSSVSAFLRAVGTNPEKFLATK